jgi:chorismate synthase
MNHFKKLQTFLAKRNPSQFLFWSENQKDYDCLYSSEFRLSFKNMLISEYPMTIFMKDGENSMHIKRIKDIKIKDGESVLGAIITVVCKNTEPSLGDITYKIIAS